MVNQDFDLLGYNEVDEPVTPSEETPLLGVQRRRSQRSTSLQRPGRTLAPVPEESDNADSTSPSSSMLELSSNIWGTTTSMFMIESEKQPVEESVQQHATSPWFEPFERLWDLLSVVMCCAEPLEVRVQREADARAEGGD